MVSGKCDTMTLRLEPTYEGLKRAPFGAKSAPIGGLEPTYEGLKQPCSSLPRLFWSL